VRVPSGSACSVGCGGCIRVCPRSTGALTGRGAPVGRGGLVTDVLYVLLTVVVFAVLALIVRGVEHL